VNVRHIAIM